MNFWNYISEILLFRWLSGKLNREEGRMNASKFDNRVDEVDDLESCLNYKAPLSHDSYDKYDRNCHSFNDFDEEQDDYDMMDDF